MAETSVVYNAPPTAKRFLRSTAKVSFIKGPIGSGKSVACCMKIMMISMRQAPGTDGVRRTRHIVVRNTRDQLKDTTLKTWLAWFPSGVIGTWKETDRTYTISFTPKDGIPVYAEVLFRALDDPADVAKVLSLEATTFWFNECREIAREIVENAIGRVGRYPDKKSKPADVPDDQWPTFTGVFGDTNAPELDSYWFNVFEHLPVDEDDPDSVLNCETFSQPAGDGSDGVPGENVENLPVGYYSREGRSEEWYRTMVQVQYAKSLKGKPVYMKSFKSDRHVSKTTLKIDPFAPVIIGLDTARTPAAVFKQMIDGRIRVQHEAVAFDMGAKNFCKMKLKPILKQFYPNNPIIFIYDPSSTRMDNTDDNSWVKVLKKEFPSDDGHYHKAAATNDPTQRILATDTALRDWPDGEPFIIYDPGLKWCIEGLRSKYRYIRIKGGDGRWQDKPEKNNWSHVIEADQYGTMFLTGKQYDESDFVRASVNPATQQVSYRPADRYAGY